MRLRNRFEGLELDGDTSQEDDWWELKTTVTEASQTLPGRMRRCRWDWVTDEAITLVEQTLQARIQRLPNHRVLRRQTTRALRRYRRAYWKEN